MDPVCCRNWCDDDRCTMHLSLSQSANPEPHLLLSGIVGESVFKSVLRELDEAAAQLCWAEVEWREVLAPARTSARTVSACLMSRPHDGGVSEEDEQRVSGARTCCGPVVDIVTDGGAQGGPGPVAVMCEAGLAGDPDPDNPENDIMLQFANSRFMYT